MLIFSLIIIQALSASNAYDIEMEGVMRIGKDFQRILSQNSAFANKLGLKIPISFASKGKLPKKTLGSAVMRAVVEPNKTDEIKVKKPDPLQDYVDHLKKKGKKTLKNISKLIKKDLNLNNKNISLMLKTVIDDYVSIMQNYYDFVIEEKRDTEIDKEFVYLDMAETSCRMLYSEERKLLNDIIMDKNSSSLNKTVQSMNEKMYKHSIKDKKDELRYVCHTYDICRQYPAFTDYSADLITEILKLPETKFQQFIGVIAKIIKLNDVFFSTISEKEDREMMTLKLQSLSTDTFGLKEFFAVLRAVITQRFKTVPNGNETLKMRTKAMRILLDIIDKALYSEEDVLNIDFDTSVSALRSWSGGARKNIDDIFEDFAKHLLRILEYNLTKNAREEISVLIEIIMRGTTSREDIYQRLFKFGSKFVKGNALLTDLEIF